MLDPDLAPAAEQLPGIDHQLRLLRASLGLRLRWTRRLRHDLLPRDRYVAHSLRECSDPEHSRSECATNHTRGASAPRTTLAERVRYIPSCGSHAPSL